MHDAVAERGHGDHREDSAFPPGHPLRVLGRVPGLARSAARVEDAVKVARFWFDASRRAALRRMLASCRTDEDYYAFAQVAFGPHQIRSEILGLLRRLSGEGPRNVCEIGIGDGGTNCLLLHALPTVEFMLGIDLFVRGKASLRYFAKPRHQLHYLDGSSYAPATVERARRLLQGRLLDVLFIDGDHSYGGVRQDFLCYRGFVRDGGLIVFHDICPDFRTRYGMATGHWAGGVPTFWQDVRALYPHETFVEHADQDGLGIGVIRYSRDVELPSNF
jgi:hypothetical protein